MASDEFDVIRVILPEPSKGRFLPGGTLVVRNADTGGIENAP